MQSSVDALSSSELLLMSNTPTIQTSDKAQPLLEQPTKPSNDVNLEPIEESLSQKKPNEKTSREVHAIATAWLRINEGV